MTPSEIRPKYNESIARTAVDNLNANGFQAFYCPSSKEAVEKVLSLIPSGSVCSWGGSVTIEETGLLEQVKKSFKVIDRDTAANGEERADLMRKALSCDVFLTSFNAVSQEGTAVNIDGNGNRVAAITFGPKSVIALVGINKITLTEEEALFRAEDVAAPKNAMRFGKEPSEADQIMNIVQILKRGGNGRIKVVIAGEELGF